MKAHVDAGLCQAHGVCHDICPDVVQLDEWGYASTDDQPVPESLEAAVRQAAAGCPERAISVGTEETG